MNGGETFDCDVLPTTLATTIASGDGSQAPALGPSTSARRGVAGAVGWRAPALPG